MLEAVLLFLLGFILLIKGGDWFVDGSAGIAKRFKIPELIIGATVVSIGTTLPEVMVSSSAAAIGNGATAYGNAIGSIICNSALICGITITAKPALVDRKPLIIPVIFFFSAAIFYSLVAYIGGEFTRPVGIILLCVFVIYMVLSVVSIKKSPKPLDTEPENESKTGRFPKWDKFKTTVAYEIIALIVGAACIAVGARLLVDNCTIIAKEIGVPETVIALTLVALGTSLPELVTAITSLIKGHGSLSLGNIIGANLFNLVSVSGMAITINPFPVPSEKLFMGYNASFVIDIPVMFLVMGILTIPTIFTKKTSRWQGIALLAICVSYYVFQFAV